MLRLLVCLVVLPFSVHTAAAQDNDRALTSGLALGIGAGMATGGLGAEALYYVQTPSERWRIAPHVGFGYFGRPALSLGFLFSFGRRHRLVMDMVGGPMAADGGTNRRTTVYYGVTALVGYEWMSRDGFALRTSIGPSIRPTLSPRDQFFFAVNLLSFDYKLW